MRIQAKGKDVTAHFDSLTELAEHIATIKKPKGARINADCSMEYGAAFDTADSGGYWENGVDRMADTAVNESSARDMLLPQLGLQQAGFAPCVPAYLAGAPEAMLAYDTLEPVKKLIRVGISVAYSCRVEDHQVANRGRAVLANVNALERAGYSVELVAVWGVEDYRRTCQVSLTVKESHDAYAPTAVAFALTENAFARRLLWSAATELGPTGRFFDKNCMGHPSDLNAASEYDIWIPSFTRGETFDTQEEADKNINAIFNNAA